MNMDSIVLLSIVLSIVRLWTVEQTKLQSAILESESEREKERGGERGRESAKGGTF